MSLHRDRKRPAHGVHISLAEPTIVFVTVCTKKRSPWLATIAVQQALIEVWQSADAWRVGFYLLMPDHLHLFCAPHKLDVSLETWVRHWKRAFSLRRVLGAGEWQRDFRDTRLRRHENYTEKWRYVEQNPVRAGLVLHPEDWPFQGCLNELRW